MTHEFIAPWWSIQLASGWLYEQEDDCANFWREDGVGALQISAHSHDSGSVPADDLEDFTKGEFPDDAALKSIRCGQFVGVGIDYVADGKFWRKRWVHQGPLLLFVTYNSDADDRAVELDAVNEMLATLKPTSDAAKTKPCS
jgi:hypothetical protein